MAISRKYKIETLESILTLYNNNLPFIVSEYVCRIFSNYIISDTKINYKTLFKPYLSIQKNVNYVFDKPLITTSGISLVKLKQIRVMILKNDVEEFLDNNSNFIYSSYDSVGLEFEEYDNLYDICTINL
jgi:hypothetical protein